MERPRPWPADPAETPSRVLREWLANAPADGHWSDEQIRVGVALARAHREALLALLPHDPERALRLAIPWRLRQGLPQAILDSLEEWISAQGRLEVLCVYDEPAQRLRKAAATSSSNAQGPYLRTFTLEDRTLRAFVYGRRLLQTSANAVALHGIVIDDQFAVHEDPARTLEADEAAAALRNPELKPHLERVCALTGRPIREDETPAVAQVGDRYLLLAGTAWIPQFQQRLAEVEAGFRHPTEPPAFQGWSHGTKRLLFMRAKFPDDLREPITEGEAVEVMRLANEFFAASSYGNLSIITVVGPLITLPQPKLYYSVRGPGTLMNDARDATREAGLDPDAFDLDIVRFESVPGFDWGGLGAVGGRGVWLQGSSLGVVCHELGHNLGLSHANFWNTVRPEPPEDDMNLPFDADSLVGLDSTIGPGDDVEYGDPFDVMGSGGGLESHFSALHKSLLGWIPSAGVQTISTSGVYRVFAHDAGILTADRPQVLRVRKDAERFYWISARGASTGNAWLENGVELHWNGWHQAIGSSGLLDTTPGSRHGTQDAAITLGRAFVDEAARLAITPWRKGFENLRGVSVPFYEVAIAFDPDPTNSLPQLQLSASALQVAVGESVVLQATSADPDGDPVAIAWDLGEGMPGPNQNTVTNRWNEPGDYVVRCEVTDLRGGRAAKHLAIRVGTVRTLRISGRVLDQSGQPLLGARVHNGMAGTNSPYSEDYRWAYTDSDGRYTLTGLEAGSYPVGAVAPGYVVRPLNFARPLILNEFTGVDVAFIAATLPRVSVIPISEGHEALQRPALFQISRQGPTQELLRVYFRTAGSATGDEDYTPWPNTEVQTNVVPTVLDPVLQEITYGFVEMPPGVVATNLLFPVLDDAIPEGDETLVLTLTYPVTRTTITETETNIVDIPGWQVLGENGQDTWFQTQPYYHLTARDEAINRVIDRSAPGEPTLSIVALDTEASENLGDSASFLISRVGRAPSADLRIPLQVTGTAIPGEDYLALPAEWILPATAEAALLRVEVLDDRFVEGNETVRVTLGTGTGYRLGAASAEVTLVDDDLPWVTVSALDPVVDETASSARVSFQRTGDLHEPLEVDYLFAGTATAGMDYLGAAGRITIPAGSSSTTLALQPLNDALEEGDETIIVQVGDSPVYNVAAPAAAVVVLRDDEFPIVSVEVRDAEAIEGDDTGQFVIRRTGPLARPLLVRYRLGGSAIHQADYVASGDQIEMGVNQSQVVITVLPIDDALREDPETIAIELIEDPAYSLGIPSRGVIELLDNNDNEPGVGFALLSTSGLESRTEPDLAVRISGNPDEGDENAVTVAWEILGGTALQGADFVLAEGTLVFPYVDPEGDEPLSNRVAFIPLQIIDDSLAETDETILIRLRIAPTVLPADDPEAPPTLVTNGVRDVYAVHTYTILDDDLAELQVTASPDITAEGSGIPARFTISRVGPTNVSQTVVVHLSGLAAPGSDFLDIPRHITLPAGAASVDIPIVPVDDPISEYREDVVLSLVSAPGSRLASPRTARVLIDDNDGTIEFTSARHEVNEADGVARIGIRRTGDTNILATAYFEASPLTAEAAYLTNQVLAGDFVPTNAVVTFPPGVMLREVEVALLNDDAVESPETIQLRLSRGSDLFPLGGQNVAVLTIVDDDGLLTTGTNVAAGIEADLVVEVTLERAGPVDGPLTLQYVTENFTAEAGQDYVGSEGTVEFGAGQRSVAVEIPLLNDFEIEGDETFLLRFFSTGGTLVGEVSVFVVDDDCTIEFAAASAEVDEDAGVIDLLLIRQGAPLNPVSVDFRAMSGTASEGQDFPPASGTLHFLGNRFETLTNGTGEVVFLAGESNKVVTIPILNDAEGERDEVFTVALSNVRPGDPGLTIPFALLGTVSNSVVTIRDNEAPGRLDDQFQPGLGADATVRALALQRDGKVLVGGDFTTLDGVVLPRLGRLHADGFLDRSFNPGRGFDGSVLAAAEISEGRLLVGGTFLSVDGQPHPHLVRLEPDGTLAEDVFVHADGPVRAIARSASGWVFVGGDFSRVANEVAGGVARLTAEGAFDPTFQTGAAARTGVHAVAPLADGRVWVGGSFTGWNGSGRYLVRLLEDGTTDPGFRSLPALDGAVHALAIAPDGSVYVGGEFTTVGGIPRAGLARLLPNGALDTTFDPGSGANGLILAAELQSESRMITAGAFDQFADVPAGRFVRLDPDGAADATFFRGTGANDVVRALAVQPDGAILIGGDFTTVNDRPRLRIARIHSDEAFSEGVIEFSQSVYTAAETDGNVTVTVRRRGTARTEARVRFQSSDLTATAGEDYEPAAGELRFAPGETLQSFPVVLLEDARPEGSETVILSLTNFMGGLPGRIATATVVIADNEAAVAFELARVDVDEDSGVVPVVVRRSGPLDSEMRVLLRTEAGTATALEDFVERSDILVFPIGTATNIVELSLIDDTAIEGTEFFHVRLEDPSNGVALGTQSILQVNILDNDQPPTHFSLSVEPSPGGVVVPGGGRFPTNSVQSILAVPDAGFEFSRWEGTVVSAANPLLLLMDRNHVLAARFIARDYLETFETGDFSRLPWQTTGDAAWTVTSNTAAGGRFSAQSGAIQNRGASVLSLEHESSTGSGSFDFRTDSERGWDFLEFRLNGVLVERWSGIHGWQAFQFNVPSGRNHLEWRFTRDATFGTPGDAAWIDNLDLPEVTDPTAAPRIELIREGGGCAVRIEGHAGTQYFLEVSTDMAQWTVVASAPGSTAPFVLTDPQCANAVNRFYRVRAL